MKMKNRVHKLPFRNGGLHFMFLIREYCMYFHKYHKCF